MWLEDASYERYWVDRPECKDFVDIIISSFGTIVPAANLLPAPDGPGSSLPSLDSASQMQSEADGGFRDDLATLIEENKMDVKAIKTRYNI
jgi:hypothetical protein